MDKTSSQVNVDPANRSGKSPASKPTPSLQNDMADIFICKNQWCGNASRTSSNDDDIIDGLEISG